MTLHLAEAQHSMDFQDARLTPCLQDTQFEHVLCVPLLFHQAPGRQASQHCVFLCSCDQMQDPINAVRGLGITSRTCHTGKIKSLPTTMHCTCIQASAFMLRCPKLMFDAADLYCVGMPEQ